MIFDRIRRLVRHSNKRSNKEIAISCEPLERRVALLEDGLLEEFAIERGSQKEIASNIYKGRVNNVDLGLKALFVDIGIGKNAFLHFWDAIPAALDVGVELFERKGTKSKVRPIRAEDIPNIYPPGSEVVVQVTKGPIGTKGPRVTTNITLAGRYLVLMPFNEQFGISRKIEDPKERVRLRKILNELRIPEGMGLIIRTVGEGQKTRYFIRDLAILLQKWNEIERKMKEYPAPVLLYMEPDLIERTVRDFLTDDVEKIYVDNEQEVKRIKDLVAAISKRSQRKIIYYNEPIPLFEKLNIERQIDTAFMRKVELPSGGYIIIDETEALVAIDVNTGKAKMGKDQDNTILKTNIEAAKEISRQLRLRNIGGLVVIDFIDMKSRKEQHQVFEQLKECIRKDRAKINVLPISAFGLVEMTRQRVQESIWHSLYIPCPHCHGRGMVKSPETMSIEIQRAINRVIRLHPEVKELRVILNSDVLDRLKSEDEELLVDLERRMQGKLYFRTDPRINYEEFKIQNAITGEDIT
ncbi:ribonuclease [Methylacidiphilum kamchatkense Kam1]|uniref:Ribonuclease n=1 Tax=Methylacidiphilum kamchatkense Kam1 TaxID=1202785 RepID=A0A0C1UTK9_9BACT|nr:Rne/Rng family ribonuclease [Methylacidiphilum kamchatkense]KIE59118.1 ribonuclease [Methylacidiphilum kamchatkense Kam1]QDQ42963.1 ribonuclease G [Methylacidiphilum kamchatkense Kam1]